MNEAGKIFFFRKLDRILMIATAQLKLNKTIYHLGFWFLAYFFWIYIFRNNTLVISRTITIQFCYLVFIAANYYFNSLYAIPQLLNRKKYIAFGLSFIAAIAVTALL